jgi:hypothetical protein
MPILSGIGFPQAESDGSEHLLPFERVRPTFNSCRS